MALASKPVTLTQRAAVAGELTPEPLVVVGSVPVTAVAANVVIDASPADATAVATDLIALQDALIAAGLMAAA